MVDMLLACTEMSQVHPNFRDHWILIPLVITLHHVSYKISAVHKLVDIY